MTMAGHLGTVTKTLNSFGIASQDTCREIFQYIVENLGNYLKYYLGYLNFMDLKKEAQTAAGKSFQLKEFHRYDSWNWDLHSFLF